MNSDDLPSNKGLTQTGPQIASGTTGSGSAERKPSNVIGMLRSETGAVAMLNDLQTAMEADEPERTDKTLLALLPPLFVSSLAEKNREFVDPVYGYDFEFSHYEPKFTLSPKDKIAAGKIIASTLRPDQRVVVKELVRLRAMTKAKAESGIDMEIAIEAFTDELAKYPPDVVRASCRKYARMNTFWPSLAELVEMCDRLVRRRRALERLTR